MFDIQKSEEMRGNIKHATGLFKKIDSRNFNVKLKSQLLLISGSQLVGICLITVSKSVMVINYVHPTGGYILFLLFPPSGVTLGFQTF